MEQICSLQRNLEWKEKCDDIFTLCDADVLPAVDHWTQEAGFHRDFPTESSVWLDGAWLGGGVGLGVRERRPAASVCDGWPGAVLRSLRCNDRGRSFLPELRAAAVSQANDKALSETQPSAASRLRRDAHAGLRGSAGIQATSVSLPEILPSAVSRTTRSGENFACASGISRSLLRKAKDGAPVRGRIVLLSGPAGATRSGADSGVR
jgi:hypothetical protein